jgi:hypothetical protein
MSKHLCALVAGLTFLLMAGVAQAQPQRALDEITLDSGVSLSDWLSSSEVKFMTDPLKTAGQAADYIRRYGPYRELLNVVWAVSKSSMFDLRWINGFRIDRQLKGVREARSSLGDWPRVLMFEAKASVFAGDTQAAVNALRAWLRVIPQEDPDRTKIVDLLLSATKDKDALAKHFAPQGLPGLYPDSKGCRVFRYEPPKPNEVLTWSGDCPGGIAEGQGTLELQRDGKFVWSSEFTASKGEQKFGRYVTRYANGGTLDTTLDPRTGETRGTAKDVPSGNLEYSGSVAEGWLVGRGILRWKVGFYERVEGDFSPMPTLRRNVDFYPTGQVTEVRSDGDRYEGPVVRVTPINGREWPLYRRGRGVLKYGTGGVLDAQFEGNEPAPGQATYTDRAGRRFEGRIAKKYSCFISQGLRAVLPLDQSHYEARDKRLDPNSQILRGIFENGRGGLTNKPCEPGEVVGMED